MCSSDLKDVELTDINKKLVAFVGKNRKGKTSWIKAITTGLKGTTDTSVIREGAEKSEIMLDLEGLQVQRTITRKGQNKLKVITKDGDIKASPQSFLDGLLSDFSFDPIGFVAMNKTERMKYLRELFKTRITPAHLEGVVNAELLADMKIDYTEDGLSVCQKIEDILYPLRRERNKATAQKKALYEATVRPLKETNFNPKFKDRSAEIEVGEAALNNLIADAQIKARQADGTAALIARVKDKISAAQAQKEKLRNNENFPFVAHLDALEKESRELTAQIKLLVEQRNVVEDKRDTATAIKGSIDSIDREIELHNNTVENLPKVEDVPDINALQAQLNDLLVLKVENNKDLKLLNIHKNAEMLLSDWTELQAQADQLTESIKKLRKDVPERLSSEAQFPIPELRFEGDQVFIGKVSMEHLSTSEQVGVALRIVRELNKQAPLKVLCLDRAEILDDDSLNEFTKQIEADEFQYFITIVSHKGQKMPAGSLHVNDGEIQ